MTIRYLSVCSGIEAASVAWHHMGWEPLAFSEIEKFPRTVLAHHYPDVPLHGDFTQLRDQPWIVDADVLVGGTPCQAFSVAGLRNSLADDRGNLTLEFVRLADAIDDLRHAFGRKSATVVWENVPGVLSVKDNAFGCFLAALVGNDAPLVPTGGKWTNAGLVVGPARTAAWRVLDAQYFGVAQRRRRVFVVASARDGFDPAEVLFEREGVRRDTPPRREAGQAAAGGSGKGVDASGLRHTVGTLCADTHPGSYSGQDAYRGRLVPATAHTLRASGFDASEDGTGRGTPLVPVSFTPSSIAAYREGVGTLRANGGDLGGGSETLVAQAYSIMPMNSGKDYKAREVEVAQPLMTSPVGGNQGGDFVVQAYDLRGREGGSQLEGPHDTANLRAASGGSSRSYVAFSCKDYGADAINDISPTLRSMGHADSHANGGGQVAVVSGFYPTAGQDFSCIEELSPPVKVGSGGSSGNPPGAQYGMAVRRLTPRECERLQGFPDDYTLLGERTPDGPRYKALGNSMAVPVMRWIGERINKELAQ